MKGNYINMIYYYLSNMTTIVPSSLQLFFFSKQQQADEFPKSTASIIIAEPYK